MTRVSGPKLHFPIEWGHRRSLNSFNLENLWAKRLLLSQVICMVGGLKMVPLFIGALTVFPFSAPGPVRGMENSRDVGFT